MNVKGTQVITDKSDPSITSYFRDIRRLSRITPDEEAELAKRIRQGDKEAEKQLIEANLRFVISVAKRYQNKGVNLSDLIQEGNLALIQAAKLFDETRGFRFISYAVWWIRQAMIKAISDQSRVVRVPINQIVYNRKINKFIDEYSKCYDVPPNEKDIEENTGLDSRLIYDYLNINNKPISLEKPIVDEDGLCLLDIMPNDTEPIDKELDVKDLSKITKNLLDKLSDRNHDIICMYFGIGVDAKSLENIGNKFGLTSERVRQLIQEILKKLRKRYKSTLMELI